MKKWWKMTPVEFWVHLFVREKTRWIAVVLFLLVTAAANWMVIDTALEGSRPIQQPEPTPGSKT
jgi:hypothetical protein